MTARTQLQSLELRITRIICNGGFINAAEADLLGSLRETVGQQYDAVNGVWRALDA